MRRPGVAVWVVLFALAGAACALPVPAGIPCAKHEECDGLPEGYCARAGFCTRECSDAKPCPEGSACVAGPTRSVCLEACTEDATCPARHVCREGVCVVADVLAP